MTLLYEAAKKVHSPNGGLGTAALNPTPGLKRRDPELFKRIVWKADPNDPNKGVFVATEMDSASRQLERELPPGILVTQSAVAANQAHVPPGVGNQNLQQQIGQQPHMNQHNYNTMNGNNNVDQLQQANNMAQMPNQGATHISTEPVSYLVSLAALHTAITQKTHDIPVALTESQPRPAILPTTSSGHGSRRNGHEHASEHVRSKQRGSLNPSPIAGQQPTQRPASHFRFRRLVRVFRTIRLSQYAL